MAPNTSILQARVDAFRENLVHLSQQKMSKLRAYTDYFSPEAETGNWDRLGAGEMAVKNRDTASSGNETGRVWSRRTAVASPFNDHELTEVEDPSMMIIDPNSNLVQSLGFSAGRQYDRIIIQAATGGALNSVRDGAGGNVPTTIALPAGQTVGDGTTAISFDLVTEAQEKFTANDIDPSVPKIFVIGPRQLRELMNLTENTSSDYVQLQQLQQYGMAPNWLGFNWILSTLLTGPGGAVDGTRECFAMTYDAVGLHVPEEMTTFVERDPSRQYAWRPYCQMTLGAVRIEDEKVVACHVLDATNA